MAEKVKNKVLIIENFASDFYKARVSLALYLKREGWDVYAMVPRDEVYNELIKLQGINLIEYNLNRKNKGIFQIIKLCIQIRKELKEKNFSIVHSFRFQPNVLNLLASIGQKHTKIIHITGLGIAFSNNSFKFLIYRLLSQVVFFFKFKYANKVIFQNKNDQDDLYASRFFRKKLEIINGSGIDISVYDPLKFNTVEIRKSLEISPDYKVFICVTRLIWEKGIYELVEAFKEFKETHKNVILLIVGKPDYANPRHVNDEFIANSSENNRIRFLGLRKDIPQLLACSDFFILPSYYREGIPRSLLEALSMGLPIITTDMPGCKETVNNDINGILISPKSIPAIKGALEEIINRNSLFMRKASRSLAIEKFQNKIIFQEIDTIYRQLI